MYCITAHSAQYLKLIKVSVIRFVDKEMLYIYTTEYYLDKKSNVVLCSNMNKDKRHQIK